MQNFVGCAGDCLGFVLCEYKSGISRGSSKILPLFSWVVGEAVLKISLEFYKMGLQQDILTSEKEKPGGAVPGQDRDSAERR